MSNIQEEIQSRVRTLLENGTVSYFIGWEATRFEDKTRPAFITKPEDASKLVWNKYCINGTAKYLLDDRYPDGKIGILVRGCDSRAVNRILKDKQAVRENLYIIGIVCDGKENPVCDSCQHKNPLIYDELIGETVEEKINPDRFKDVIEFEALSQDEKYEYWAKQYDKCIHCYACRNVCPACSCKECYADQARENWQGKQNNRNSNQVYGLTRAFHVGDRCIECGECERACPMGLPIMRQTKKMLKDINDLFGNYECGLDAEKEHVLGEFDLNDADEFM